MDACGTAGRLGVGLVAVVFLAGCGAGMGPTSDRPTSTPSSLPSEMAATPTPRPTPTVVVTRNVAYESANPVLVPGTLDVYAPAAAGRWPVVVLFHGAPETDPVVDRSELSDHAWRLAELGFVVFNASWGHEPGGPSAVPTYAGLSATQAQAACAVEFARARAAEYRGDPASMIVFGHSGGAHAAAMVTFNRPEPTAGCLGGATLGAIDALVTWEGNWLLSVNYPDWDSAIAADPRVMAVVTPWTTLSKHKDQKVVMLVSEHPGPGFERRVGNPWARDSWLAGRDPSRNLRRQLEASGAFTDGTLDMVEVQQLLFSVLKAQGNPVSLDTMPGSSHAYLSDAGWKVFLAAFPRAAGRS